MMLRASVYLSFDHVAVNVWTETQDTPDAPIVIASVRHTYVEVPDAMAELPDMMQCLEALRWAVQTAIQQRRGAERQTGG